MEKEIISPLVSVVVITYNSSQYVIETLESVRDQIYSNIELIITDDCSTDNTIELCKEWVKCNNSRFVRVEILTSIINTGVPGNCNRGYSAAHGEWIKGIAGDDILTKDGIEKFIREYNGYDLVVFGNCRSFYVDDFGVKVFNDTLYPEKYQKTIFNLDVHQQFNELLNQCLLCAPSSIIKKTLLQKVGCYDERYRRIEDWPFWLKCTRNNFRLAYQPVLLAYYRTNHGSITSHKGTWYNESYYQDRLCFIINDILPHVSKWNLLYWEDYYINRLTHLILYKYFGNIKTPCSRIVEKLLVLLSPKKILFSIYYKLRSN